MLHYSINPKSLGAHLIHVDITTQSTGTQLTARLPKWIPGSYKIRDYSRFVQSFAASTAGSEALNWYKTDSDTWVIDTPKDTGVHLSYDVYAYDLSVRGSYLDDTRMFFNHCCVALDIIEYTCSPRTIRIDTVDDWRIFTALPCQADGLYYADDYNHQIDCPVESAQNYLHSEFTVNDIRHDIVFTGCIDDNDDTAAMTAHIKNICQAEMNLFGGTPLDSYLFLNYIEPKQYGGLEHKNSVAQVASPEMLMKKGQPLTEQMINFLGLCSHEYFHLWNVKRLQPKDFQPYDLYREQHTEMLWFFEGITSYYDELFLLRAGVVNAQIFLTRQAKNLTRVLSTPGRFLQPLAASSYDAWTKLYQADANSPNHMVSYYSKGAIFALCLDLFIRKHSDGSNSTDDLMRYLWQHYGEKGIGIDEEIVFTTCSTLIPKTAHAALAHLFVEGLHGTSDLPVAELLTDFGVSYSTNKQHNSHGEHSSDAGLKIDATGTITFLNSNSNAADAGVSVGDSILAIDNYDHKAIDFTTKLTGSLPGTTVTLTLSRRGRVFTKNITLTEAVASEVNLSTNGVTSLGNDWLSVWHNTTA